MSSFAIQKSQWWSRSLSVRFLVLILLMLPSHEAFLIAPIQYIVRLQPGLEDDQAAVFVLASHCSTYLLMVLLAVQVFQASGPSLNQCHSFVVSE